MEETPIGVIEIPDPLFFAYLVENFDLDGDGEISVEEAKNVLEIICPAAGIQSLEGIEYFENLTRLDCPLNRLIKLDICRNTKLEELDCRFNSIGELDLSNNPELKIVLTKGNRLKTLNISSIEERIKMVDADKETKVLVSLALPLELQR